MGAYTDAMHSYFEFGGRSSRREFWLFALVCGFLCVIAAVIDGTILGDGRRSFGVLGAIVILVHVVPAVAVSVRRLHDTGRTGWWIVFFWLTPVLIALIGMLAGGGAMVVGMQQDPIAPKGGLGDLGVAFILMLLVDLVIAIVAIAFYATQGTRGSNRFGALPAE